MKKVKFITDHDVYSLEHTVNEFLSTHNVIDIQFQYATNKYRDREKAVMIIYEEEANDNERIPESMPANRTQAYVPW